MGSFFKDKLDKIVSKILGTEKRDAEVRFWKNEIQNYIKWCNGEIQTLYGNPSPHEKAKAHTKELSAILTFFEIHQKNKYQKDLLLDMNAFKGMRVLDIGSGPFPSGLCFSECELYCLDPLHDSYLTAGYPIHCYDQRARFVHSFAENMPFDDEYMDAVISVNAIDHVDDFAKTAKEIKRVLKPGGRFRMHVHYHPMTTAEPIELNDEVFLTNYGWVRDIKKINTSRHKTGTSITNERESYVVWGN
jgi:SAM-dependent methyltransferase